MWVKLDTDGLRQGISKATFFPQKFTVSVGYENSRPCRQSCEHLLLLTN